MCGICGEFRWGPDAHVDPDLIGRMMSRLVHRGPDDEGCYVKGPIGIGMRRLSIIDVAGGHQPIFNEDKTVAVVYNGEIYNFQELRQELEGLGHRFETKSDTEVLVHGYEVWGDAFPEHLNGMFAFALWDEKKKRLLLGRDRMGIKPLYYGVFPDKIAFASEIKSLLEDTSFSREIDPLALDEYLSLRYVPAPRSIFSQIKKLEPGHTLAIEGGSATKNRYWFFKPQPPKRRFWFRRALEELDALLSDAVKRQLISEVPLGIFLSGGLDSPTIAYYASQSAKDQLTSFNIYFKQASYSEREPAKACARKLGLNHKEMEVEPEIRSLLPQLADVFDEPFADDSMIPTFFLTKLAREHMTVALSGDGGDELFAGYPTYIADRASRYYRHLPAGFQKLLTKTAHKMLPVSFEQISFDFKVKAFLGAAGRSQPAAHFGWQEIFTEEDKAQLYHPEFKSRVGEHCAWESFERAYEEAEGRNPIEKLLYVDQKTFLADEYLVKVDRLSMAHSLEVRPPFLDHRLVEFAAGLPVRYKLRGQTTKYMIRRLMRKRLPSEILRGAKKGFSPPLAFWLTEKPFARYVANVFSSSVFKSGKIINEKYALKLLEDHKARRRNNTRRIWTLLMLALWMERYGGWPPN